MGDSGTALARPGGITHPVHATHPYETTAAMEHNADTEYGQFPNLTDAPFPDPNTPVEHAPDAPETQDHLKALLLQLKNGGGPAQDVAEVPQPSMSPLNSSNSPQTPAIQPGAPDGQTQNHITDYQDIAKEEPVNELYTQAMVDHLSLADPVPLPDVGDVYDQMSMVPDKQVGFAKFIFDDGSYVLNTQAVEFGRDTDLLRQAQQFVYARKSGGRKKEGSIISEKAGIFRVDLKDEIAQEHIARGTEMDSSADAVDPRDLDFTHDSRLAAISTGEMNGYDDEIPAPVTSEHLPNPHIVPIVPLHNDARTAEGVIEFQRKISRVHIKVFWNDGEGRWQLDVMGRNGCFLIVAKRNPERVPKFLPWYKSPVVSGKEDLCDDERKSGPWNLSHGDTIQIEGIQMTFTLPQVAEDPYDSNYSDEDVSVSESSPTTPEPRSLSRALDPSLGNLRKDMSDQTNASTLVSGEQLVKPKRKVGRPPKDGISSKRQKMLEKRAMLEKLKNNEAPSPTLGRSKSVKPQIKPSETSALPPKRKYTKRSREEENVVQSIEGADDLADGNSEDGSEGGQGRPAKRAKKSRSKSPDYPPLESLTADQLKEPTEPYLPMIHRILSEKESPQTLRQIYRAIKLKFPSFRTKASEGWTSSVRHNLNSGAQDGAFIKGKKDGKGFFWSANTKWTAPRGNEKKRQTNPQPQPEKSKTINAPPRPQLPYGPPHAAQWPPHQQPNLAAPSGSPFQWANGQPPPQWMPNGHMQPPTAFGLGMQPNQSQNAPLPNYTFQGPPPPPSPNSNGIQPGSAGPGQPPAVQGAPNGFPQSIHQAQPSQPTNYTPQQSLTPVPGPSGTQAQSAPRAPQAPPSTGTYAGSPCTMEGIETIKVFEEKYKSGSSPEDLDRLTRACNWARARLLHGKSVSELGPPDWPTLHPALDQIGIIINAYPNSNFRGFRQAGPEQKTTGVPTKEEVVAEVDEVERMAEAEQEDPSANADGGEEEDEDEDEAAGEERTDEGEDEEGIA